jgi:hypothetical protein
MKKYLSWKMGVIALVIVALVALMLPSYAFADMNVASADSASLALENVQVDELDGADLGKAVADALKNQDVKTMRSFLVKEGFTPQIDEATGQKVNLKEEGKTQDIVVLIIPFSDAGEDDSAKLVFSTNGDEAKVGAGIMLGTGPTTSLIQAYDVTGGKVIHSATITANIDGTATIALYLEKQADGTIISTSPNPGKVFTSSSVSTLSMTNCEACLYVCGILTGGGCSVAGYFYCVALCFGVGNITCPFICAALIGIVCFTTGYGFCTNVCNGLGFCS